MATYVPWVPVRNSGCGWRECPLCGPLVELEIKIEHEKRVAGTYATRTQAEQVGEFLADMSGQIERGARPGAVDAAGAGVYQDLANDRARARAAADAGADTVRVKRTFTVEQQRQLTAWLHTYPIRRAYRRTPDKQAEWHAEVWCELWGPSALCARRENRLRGSTEGILYRKLQRAVSRAQKRIKAQNAAIGVPLPEGLS